MTDNHFTDAEQMAALRLMNAQRRIAELEAERELMMKVVEAAIEWSGINSAESDDITMDDGVWACNALDNAVGDWLIHRTNEIMKGHADE